MGENAFAKHQISPMANIRSSVNTTTIKMVFYYDDQKPLIASWKNKLQAPLCGLSRLTET